MPPKSPKKDQPVVESAKANVARSDSQYLTSFLRYLLVGIVLAYFHHIGGADLVSLWIGKLKSAQQGHEGMSNSKYDPYVSYDGKFYPNRWDDEKFMSEYVCDPNHGYKISFLSREPVLIHIENFLQPGEAEHMKLLGYPNMEKSTVVADDPKAYHPGRTSQNAFLAKSADAVTHCIEMRAANFTKLPLENIEPLQVVWYQEGQEYQPHYDYFPPGSAGADRELLRGGQRLVTFFVYLSSVPIENGGGTIFPKLDNLIVPATRNGAAFWFDSDEEGNVDERTFHGGAPVHGAEKWGLNIWIRQRAFD